MATTSEFLATKSEFPSSSQLPMSEAYQSMDDNLSPSHGYPNEVISCGSLDRIHPAFMATCLPSFVIARLSTRTRFGFFVVFLVCFPLYFGGIASFITATRLSEPALTTSGERTDIALVVFLAWGTYVCGWWITPLMQFMWAASEGLSEEVHKGNYRMGETAFYLLVVHWAIQLVLTIIMFVLICKLCVWKSRSCVGVLAWYCFCCCCPACALGATAVSVQKAEDDTVDQIPAYEA